MNRAEAGKLGALAARATIARLKQKRTDSYDKDPACCKQCLDPIPYDKRVNKFCNHSCAATFNNPQNAWIGEATCRACHTEIHGRKVYCSRKCFFSHRSLELVAAWLADPAAVTRLSSRMSKHLKEQAGHKCSKCCWGETNPHTGTIPVEIDHIDGNSTNNFPSNLRVLCPNCHALTSTYRGANRGNGRADRRAKYLKKTK